MTMLADRKSMSAPVRKITFRYVNHKGKDEMRHALPLRLEYETNPGYSYQPGWFLKCWDFDRKGVRSFALSRIVFEDNLHPMPLEITSLHDADALSTYIGQHELEFDAD